MNLVVKKKQKKEKKRWRKRERKKEKVSRAKESNPAFLHGRCPGI